MRPINAYDEHTHPCREQRCRRGLGTTSVLPHLKEWTWNTLAQRLAFLFFRDKVSLNIPGWTGTCVGPAACFPSARVIGGYHHTLQKQAISGNPSPPQSLLKDSQSILKHNVLSTFVKSQPHIPRTN